jgi:hypothetical protein
VRGAKLFTLSNPAMVTNRALLDSLSTPVDIRFGNVSITTKLGLSYHEIDHRCREFTTFAFMVDKNGKETGCYHDLHARRGCKHRKL